MQSNEVLRSCFFYLAGQNQAFDNGLVVFSLYTFRIVCIVARKILSLFSRFFSWCQPDYHWMLMSGSVATCYTNPLSLELYGYCQFPRDCGFPAKMDFSSGIIIGFRGFTFADSCTWMTWFPVIIASGETQERGCPVCPREVSLCALLWRGFIIRLSSVAEFWLDLFTPFGFVALLTDGALTASLRCVERIVIVELWN